MPNGSTTVTQTARRLQHQTEKITKLENQIATQQATISTLTPALQHQAAAAQLLSTLIHNRAPQQYRHNGKQGFRPNYHPPLSLLLSCNTASAGAADPASTPGPPAPPPLPPNRRSSPPPSPPLAAPAVLRPPPVDPAAGSYADEPYVTLDGLHFEGQRRSKASALTPSWTTTHRPLLQQPLPGRPSQAVSPCVPSFGWEHRGPL